VRIDGYLPIADYAVIGDGHTAALVGRDGSVDWLCLPRFDSEPVLDRLLDARAGGCFELRPDGPFESVRRYREHTNVLETTFRTAAGSVRVTDAMTLGEHRELVRLVDALEGRVPMRWRVTQRRPELELESWDAGDGWFELEPGRRATFVLSTLPTTRTEAELRLERASARWMDWAARARYEGPWREAVVRSALVLKLLTYVPTGAIVAAATTSLPERIGGERNWDYRYSWLRDGIYTMRALLALGYREEAEAFFGWQLDALERSHPEIRPLYTVDGEPHAPERERELPGYRGSRPVRTGNAAAGQLQLDVYGHVLESASRLRGETGSLRPEAGRRLAEVADATAAHWRQRDAGIWELRGEEHDFVQSKAMCWTALDRAADLAQAGAIPGDAARWRREADAVREWIEREGWSEAAQSYVRAPELGDEVDAALLSLPLCAYSDAAERRFRATADAVVRELGAGSGLLHRTRELASQEGCFLACSFWLVDALGRAGRRDEGNELMAELLELSNDLGLYAEMLDPESGEHLGNFPQGLVHLALVNAAVSLERGDEA
jgi:GH15 family glucan-1,4-alpha-glucosidase